MIAAASRSTRAAVSVALGGARRPAGAPPLHRSDPALGDVAATALVAIANRGPTRSGSTDSTQARVIGDLRPFPAVRLEGQADDELGHSVRVDEALDRGSIGGRCASAPEGDEGQGAAVRIGHGNADSTLPEVDPEQALHGFADPADGAVEEADDGATEGPFEAAWHGWPVDGPGDPPTAPAVDRQGDPPARRRDRADEARPGLDRDRAVVGQDRASLVDRLARDLLAEGVGVEVADLAGRDRDREDRPSRRRPGPVRG